jgi:hypothetical protein
LFPKESINFKIVYYTSSKKKYHYVAPGTDPETNYTGGQK